MQMFLARGFHMFAERSGYEYDAGLSGNNERFAAGGDVPQIALASPAFCPMKSYDDDRSAFHSIAISTMLDYGWFAAFPQRRP